MNYQEVKERLLEGSNLANDAAGWYTINRVNIDGVMCICCDDEYHNYTTIRKYANAVVRLLNTGTL